MSEQTPDGHTGLTDVDLRDRALESLLTEKGLVEPDALNELIAARTTPHGQPILLRQDKE